MTITFLLLLIVFCRLSSYKITAMNNIHTQKYRHININARLVSIVQQYRPSLFVLASQMVAATLNAAAKFVETRPEATHPFMILHIRMFITGLGCTLHLWHNTGTSKSQALFGMPDVRGLMLLRALGGVCGATGFFCRFVFCNLLGFLILV